MELSRPLARSTRRSGFTLVELLVVLLIVGFLLAAIASLIDLSGRIARVNTQVADLQQSLRAAQYDMIRNVRMAGRGGLPRGQLPAGIAISVRNDVPASGTQARVAPGNASSPEAVEGSDILAIRGVLNTPIYQVEPASGALTLSGSPPTSGSVRLRDPSPSGVPQDLGPMIAAVQQGFPEALLLVSPLGSATYAVVELDPSGAATDVSDPTDIVLAFRITGGTHTTAYQGLSAGGGYPDLLQTVSAVGILEEHRYYVREAFRVPGDSSSEAMPRLARARVYPGTDAPHAGLVSNLGLDIADHILDLQLALAVDRDNDEQIEEADPPSAADEWIFNSAEDNENDAGQVSSWNLLPGGAPTRLFYLRLSTLGRTARRDVRFISPGIAAIEDHDYSEPAAPTDAERPARSHRRYLLQTTIDLRNVS
ncbi:MAG: prepilin-type N-terminal cleavage/methylation domain-containing protein [Thermoanaerobaculia bacterium]|nr:prepilin-type N-terminal cleavage/methylation domain-containing protein [Thermoanaerobaculia bacterium]